MLIYFSVKNFRSIKETVTLSMEAEADKTLEEYYIIEPQKGLRLLKTAIIFGPNASGKTNILRAMDFLREVVTEPFPKKNMLFDYLPFLFDEETPSQPAEFEVKFFHRGTKYLYQIALNTRIVLREKLFFYTPAHRRALVFSRSTNTENGTIQIRFGEKVKIQKNAIDILKGNTLPNNSVPGGYLKSNIEIQELENATDWFLNYLQGVKIPDLHGSILHELQAREYLEENPKLQKAVINMLKQADFSIAGYEINEETDEMTLFGEFLSFLLQRKEQQRLTYNKWERLKSFARQGFYMIHQKKDKKYLLPFAEESSGTRKYFNTIILLLLSLMNSSALLIDEFASFLHPDLIKHFFLTFLKNSTHSQFITTTHHRELLLEKDILRRDIIWFTDRKEDLSTDLFSLADFETSTIRKANSYYNFYKQGKLGAVPKLGSHYTEIE